VTNRSTNWSEDEYDRSSKRWLRKNPSSTKSTPPSSRPSTGADAPTATSPTASSGCQLSVAAEVRQASDNAPAEVLEALESTELKSKEVRKAPRVGVEAMTNGISEGKGAVDDRKDEGMEISIDYEDPRINEAVVSQAKEPASDNQVGRGKSGEEAKVRGRNGEKEAENKEPRNNPSPRERVARSLKDKIVETKKADTSTRESKRKKLIQGKRDKGEEERLFGVKKTGINFDKYDDVPVSCTGKGVPKPYDTFKDANLHELLQNNVELAGFNKPTPVQKFSMPICFAGRDLMACAQTGSGKTGGFLFPILQMMLVDSEDQLNDPNQHSRRGNSYGERYRREARPICLILSPTRELALQIHKEAQKFSYRTSIRTVCVYGGEEIFRQVMQLERGCQICIATPGRLVDLISRRRVSMSSVKYLCFDEADRMLDMGFEPQIRQIIEDSNMPNKDKRQTLMFSATFPKPIQNLAQDFLRDYVFLSVGRVGATCNLITQKVYYAEEHKKKEALMRVLPECKGLTLIFVERKRSADVLTEWLYEMGVDAVSIHGGRNQKERVTALDMFKSARCPILVATDVAARGLDIDNVTDVINFDMPSSIDTYVHRIGRTGRCGNSGTSITFVNERNKNVLHDLFHSLKENRQETPDWFIQLYRSAGTLKSSYRSHSSRFGGSDIRQQDNTNLGNQQMGLGRGSAHPSSSAKVQAVDDGWGDTEDTNQDAAGGDGWDSD